MCARAARDQLGVTNWAGPASQVHDPIDRANLRHSVYIMYPLYISIQREVDAARAAASCVDLIRGRATSMEHGYWLQDAPNHRGTERRGYGVGGNAKGPAAQPRRPNKGHIGYGSGENGTELDALYRALRGERELQCMRATSHERLAAETGEEREARFQQMRDCCYVCSWYMPISTL